MALGRLSTLVVASTALLASGAAEAGGARCEDDLLCAAGRGYTEDTTRLLQKKSHSQEELNNALVSAVIDCRTNIAQMLIDAGADKAHKQYGLTLTHTAKREGCSTRLKEMVKN